MFHVLMKGEIGISNVPAPINYQYYYGFFPDATEAFKTCAGDPLELETIKFADWLDEYLGNEEKNQYIEYLREYEERIAMTLKNENFNKNTFNTLNFESPIELYERSVVFATGYSEYNNIVDVLLEDEEFSLWLEELYDNEEDIEDDENSQKDLRSYLTNQSEKEFSELMEEFVEYRQMTN